MKVDASLNDMMPGCFEVRSDIVLCLDDDVVEEEVRSMGADSISSFKGVSRGLRGTRKMGRESKIY